MTTSCRSESAGARAHPGGEPRLDRLQAVLPHNVLAGLVLQGLDLLIDDLQQTGPIGGADAVEPCADRLLAGIEPMAQLVAEDIVTHTPLPLRRSKHECVGPSLSCSHDASRVTVARRII